MTRDTDQSSAQATVLVVDDNKQTVDILTHVLVRHERRVLQAYNGPECLETVRTQPVDVVLLDVMMPGMDGLAVCAELKRIAPALPIILVTAKDDMTTRAAGIALGVSEFVAKPVNHADLLARIQTQLSVRRLEQEAERVLEAIEPPLPSDSPRHTEGSRPAPPQPEPGDGVIRRGTPSYAALAERAREAVHEARAAVASAEQSLAQTREALQKAEELFQHLQARRERDAERPRSIYQPPRPTPQETEPLPETVPLSDPSPLTKARE
jgi:DNA-binding response OmpR family regulator